MDKYPAIKKFFCTHFNKIVILVFPRFYAFKNNINIVKDDKRLLRKKMFHTGHKNKIIIHNNNRQQLC